MDKLVLQIVNDKKPLVKADLLDETVATVISDIEDYGEIVKIEDSVNNHGDIFLRKYIHKSGWITYVDPHSELLDPIIEPDIKQLVVNVPV